MLIVRYGDHGPRVALLQILLNRRGASLKVDGLFGPKTRQAVLDFQESLRASFSSPTGEAAEGLWTELLRGARLQVVDAYDLGDERMARGADIAEAWGSATLRTGAMCNGVESVVQRTLGLAGATGSTAVLRIWGHGNLGRWLTFSVGEVVHMAREHPEEYAQVRQEWRSYIDPQHFDVMAPVLRPLSQVFAPFGSFESHGCTLGSVPKTRHLLGRIADLFGVPVTVGVGKQYIPRNTTDAFRFTGETYTAYPGHSSLESWAHSVALSG